MKLLNILKKKNIKGGFLPFAAMSGFFKTMFIASCVSIGLETVGGVMNIANSSRLLNNSANNTMPAPKVFANKFLSQKINFY